MLGWRVRRYSMQFCVFGPNRLIQTIARHSSAGILCLVFSLPVLGTAVGGITDNCSIPQTIDEANFFGSTKHFTVNITNKDDGGKVVEQIDAGNIPSGGIARVNVPAPGKGIVHCDAFNTSVAVGPARGGPGNVQQGAKQQLKIEALFVDPVTHGVVLGSIADFVNQAYLGSILHVPDLWADTNADGMIGAGDLLYSLVDLNAYTADGADLIATVNARFSPGEEFQIVDGKVAGLPGMLFSTTDFTFDPATGYHGTPYTGDGFAVTDHEFPGVPEPATLLLTCAGMIAILFATWLRVRGSQCA
jgi:hypothetical protein